MRTSRNAIIEGVVATGDFGGEPGDVGSLGFMDGVGELRVSPSRLSS